MNTIKVNYKSTNNAFIAKRWLEDLPGLFAADFEVAIRYSNEDLTNFQNIVDNSNDKLERIKAQSCLDATQLGHPYHNELTHVSIAWSEADAFVLILDNRSILNLVLNFLVRTYHKQVWHNASFDFKYIHYLTGKFPINYEDTQILAKTIINHVDVHKAITGLKALAGHKYGAWGISTDNFTKDQMYEEHVLKYAATDACATYWLWTEIQANLTTEDS